MTVERRAVVGEAATAPADAPSDDAPSDDAPSDDAPRLPQGATTPLPELVNAPVPVQGPLLPVIPRDVEPYVEPEVVATRIAAWLLIVGRAALAAWGVVVVAVTVGLRSRAGSEVVDANVVTALAWIGLTIAVVAAATGWWWSDRNTVNIHRLDRQLPSRVRCVSAWLAPIAWSALLLAMLRWVGPTDTFDVRPAITVLVFAAVVWRPYSLSRRMLRSLTRIDSDVLIGTAYVVDLAGFGLLWWQLSSWPDTVGPGDLGSTDALLGLAAAGMLGLLANVGVWAAITRGFEQGLWQRCAAHRTQHEHRQLRVRGIDPLDPEVRWALHRIHQQEFAAATAELEAGPSADEPGAPYALEPDQVEESAAQSGTVILPSRPARDELFEFPDRDDAAATPPPVIEVPAEGEEVGRAVARWTGRADADAPTHPLDRIAARSDRVGGERVDRPRRAERPRVRRPAWAEPPAGPPTPAESPSRPEPPRRTARPTPAERAAARSERSAARTDRSLDSSQTGAPLDRVSERFTGRDRPGEQPLDRISERLGGSDGGSRGNILDRLSEYGITPSETPIPDDRVGSSDTGPLRLVQRAFLLEFVRYVMLLGFACAAVSVAWIVNRAASVDLVGGDIPADAIDDLDLVRRIAFAATGAALVVTTVWAWVSAVWAGRSGLDTRRDVQYCLALVIVTAGSYATTFGLDPQRGTPSTVALVVGALGAAVAVGIVKSIDLELGGGSSTLSVWSALLLLAPVTLWAGRLDRPTEAGDPLESILFFAALQAMTWAVLAIMAGFATGAVEQRIRLGVAEAEAEAEATPA